MKRGRGRPKRTIDARPARLRPLLPQPTMQSSSYNSLPWMAAVMGSSAVPQSLGFGAVPWTRMHSAPNYAPAPTPVMPPILSTESAPVDPARAAQAYLDLLLEFSVNLPLSHAVADVTSLTPSTSAPDETHVDSSPVYSAPIEFELPPTPLQDPLQTEKSGGAGTATLSANNDHEDSCIASIEGASPTPDHWNDLKSLASRLVAPVTEMTSRRLMTAEELQDAYEVICDADESWVKNRALLRRAKRKLAVRLAKAQTGVETINLDRFVNTYVRKWKPIQPMYHCRVGKELTDDELGPIPAYATFKRKLLGHQGSVHSAISNEDPPLPSGTTGKWLPSCVHRDYGCSPPMARLLSEITRRCHSDSSHPRSIEYVHFQHRHLLQVNALLERQFWLGIDMTPELERPEHGLVAMYGKRVVGCAFLDTSVSHAHSYIPYLAVDEHWQNAGIGRKLLYLLLQMDVEKDCLLHVSATNAKAMCMYQKFGFKGETFLVGFYDKYIPWKEDEHLGGNGGWNSRGSRNAFLMRFRR